MQAISRHMYEQKENRARTDIESAVARLNKGGPDVFAAPASEKLPKKEKEKKSKKEKKQERAAAKSAAQAAAPAEVAEPIKWCWFYNNGLRGGRDCTNRNCKHDHVRVEDNIFKKTPAPQRTRSNSPAA